MNLCIAFVLKTTVDFERHTITQRKLSFYDVSTVSCELSRLEDEVAMAVARVQSTLNEVRLWYSKSFKILNHVSLNYF